MPIRRVFPLYPALLLGLGMVGGLYSQERGQEEFSNKVLPVLEKYCYDCHGDGVNKAGVTFDEYGDYATMLKDQKVWYSTKLHVFNQTMPPGDKEQPTREEIKTVLDWVENHVFWVDPKKPDPGRVTLRRLNREEYNNTIRDIFLIDFRPAETFPQDDSGYGFDNIADVLTVTPLLMEKYMAAAEQVVEKALFPPAPDPEYSVYKVRLKDGFTLAFGDGVYDERDGLLFNSDAEVSRKIKFDKPGKYLLKIKAAGTFAGNDWAHMRVKLGNLNREFKVDTKDFNPKDFTVEMNLSKADEADLSLAFINDFYAPGKDGKPSEDRNLKIFSAALEGPLDQREPEPTVFRKWLFHKPVPTDPNERRAYVSEAVGRIGRLLYRRPLRADEINKLVELAAAALRQGEPFDRSIGHAITAMLISPKFLFLGPWDGRPGPWPEVVELDEFALASRLSYFIWSSAPDDRLLTLAEKNQLKDNWKPEVGRMLQDVRAAALVKNFAGQWLQLRNLEIVSPDPKMFPRFNPELAGDMRRETELFFSDLIRFNTSVLRFLDADYTFVNKRLAEHYKLPPVPAEGFHKMSLKDTGRRGVLTQGSILTVTSDPNRTSPVKRGKWVLENVLGLPTSPAPANVPPLEINEKTLAEGNLRERMEQHRNDPGCASCHAVMDQIGFAFENFDPVGSWREVDGKHPVDSSGELPTGQKWADYTGMNQLIQKEMSGYFTKRFVEAMLTYALGRGVEYYDKTSVTEILEKTKANGYRINEILLAITESQPFRMRRSF